MVPHEGRLGGLCRLCAVPYRTLWRLSDRVATQNEEVLTALTIPNAQLNAPDALSRCRFIAGDWSLLSVRICVCVWRVVLLRYLVLQ